jgi:hypothetical protein
MTSLPRGNGCAVIADTPGVPLYSAPQVLPGRVYPTMAPGVAYQAIRTFEVYWEVERNDTLAGWVDNRMTLVLHWEGPNCFYLPRDPRALTDFSSILCFFAPDESDYFYNDAELTDVHSPLPKSGSYVVNAETPKSFNILLGGVMSLYVARDKGHTYGACDSVPFIP